MLGTALLTHQPQKPPWAQMPPPKLQHTPRAGALELDNTSVALPTSVLYHSRQCLALLV